MGNGHVLPRWLHARDGADGEHAPGPPASARGLSLDRSTVLQAILPGGQYFSVDNSRWGQVAETYGHSIGLSEFKLTTPLRQGTAVLLHFVSRDIAGVCILPTCQPIVGHRTCSIAAQSVWNRTWTTRTGR